MGWGASAGERDKLELDMESGEGEKVDCYLLAVQHSQIPAPGYLSTGFTPPLSKLISGNLKHLNQHRLG